MKPISAQIADVEENIEAIVRRNEVVDEEFQCMKTDIASLSDKILAIKVSSSKFKKIVDIGFAISHVFSSKENINGTSTFGATCHEYFESGSRRNGTYSIRPDVSRKEIQVVFK